MNFCHTSLVMLFFILMIPVASGLIRSSIDYDTRVGNCTENKPVFGRSIEGGDLRCYGKFEMVRILSFQHVHFYEVNYPQWFSVRHLTVQLMFDGTQWIDTTFVKYRHRILVEPIFGMLWYVRSRNDVHFFFSV